MLARKKIKKPDKVLTKKMKLNNYPSDKKDLDLIIAHGRIGGGMN